MDKKRIIAGFIDFIVTALIQSILIFILIIKPLLSHQMLIIEILFLNLLIILIATIYMIIRDLIGNRSIGKKILKLKIIDVNTQKKVIFISRLLRNITWILGPVEIIYFLITGTRIGDKIAKTMIVSI